MGCDFDTSGAGQPDGREIGEVHGKRWGETARGQRVLITQTDRQKGKRARQY